MSFFSEYKTVNGLLNQKHKVVFYAESRHYYPYFEKLLHDLINKVPVVYITSDKADPLLVNKIPGLKVIYIKWLLGFAFSKIRANVMIMTMPDLGNYLFKRSANVDCYIYMFHAAVSIHQQYRQHAFDNYDTIFCTGDYQQKELRRMEQLYNLKQKEIIEYGYPLLDALKTKPGNANQTILVAPSWYPNGIFESCFDELLSTLSKMPYPVIIRSHPEYEKRNKKKYKKIKEQISRYSHMQIDNLTSITERLPLSDILITDRSGIAFEFAFGMGKPVLFIDTPPKINNSNYTELEIEPIENSLRSELGITISPGSLHQLPDKFDALFRQANEFAEKMDQIKKKIFYNSLASYKAGLEYVLEKVGKD